MILSTTSDTTQKSSVASFVRSVCLYVLGFYNPTYTPPRISRYALCGRPAVAVKVVSRSPCCSSVETISLEKTRGLSPVRPNVLDRLGLSEQDLASISYTQWEALLAIYNGKPLFVATPVVATQGASAPQDTILADAWIADLQKKMQQKHLDGLKSLGKRSDFQYESAHHLVAHVNRVLYDILPHSDSKVSPSVPASLGSLFKGRENWFARIRQQIKKARGADSVRVVLHGIGGSPNRCQAQIGARRLVRSRAGC